MRLVAGQTYRIVTEVRQTVAPGGGAKNQFTLELWGLNSSFVAASADVVNANVTGFDNSPAMVGVADGWRQIAIDVTINGGNTAVYARSKLVMTALASSTVQVARLSITNISETVRAKLQADAAALSASNASASEGVAGAAATSASTSANNASSSLSAVQGIANQIIPDRPSNKTDFVSAYTMTASPDLSVPLAFGSVVAVSVEGNVLDYNAFGAVATRGMLAVGAARTFQIDSRSAIVTGGSGYTRKLSFIVYSSSYAYLGEITPVDSLTSSTSTYTTQTLRTTSAAITALFSTAAFVRAKFEVLNGSAPQWRLAQLRFRDISDLVATENSASAASVSASTASTKAGEASNSADSATTSANTASSAYDNTNKLVAQLLPDRYKSVGNFFTANLFGNPDTVTDLPSNATAAGYGPVYQAVLGSSATVYFATRGVIPATSTRVYKVEVEVQRTAQTGSPSASVGFKVGVEGLTSVYADVSGVLSPAVNALTGSVQTFAYFFSDTAVTGRSAWPAGSIWIRPFAQIVTDGSVSSLTVQVRRLSITDVTESTSALAASTAASVSASTASTKADEAGTSATSANTSALVAQSTRTILLPDRPAARKDHFEEFATIYTPDTAPYLTNGTVVAVAGEGDVYQDNVYHSGGLFTTITTRGVLAISSGRTFQIDTRSRIVSGGSGYSRNFGFLLYDQNYQYLNFISGSNTSTSTSWVGDTLQKTSAELLAVASNAVYIRGYAQVIGGTCPTFQYSVVRLRDETSTALATFKASQAAQSATDASGSASTASTQAGIATTAAFSSQQVANTLLPDRPAIRANFTEAYTSTGSPDNTVPLSTGTIVAVTNEGDVLQFNDTRYIATRGMLPVGSGRTFVLDTRSAIVSGGSGYVRYTLFFVYGASYNYLGQYAVNGSGSTSTAYQANSTTATSAQLLSGFPTAAYIRGGFSVNGGTLPTWQVSVIRLRDETSSTAASTSAGSASTSAASAAQSVVDANSAATTATTQAGLATSANFTAQLTASLLMPSDFIQDGRYWSANTVGNPVNLTSIVAGSVFSFTDVSGIGRVMQITSSGFAVGDFETIGAVKVVAGRRYRATTRYRQTSGTLGGIQLFLGGRDANYNFIGGAADVLSSGSTAALNTWYEVVVDADADTLITAGTVYLRPVWRPAQSGAAVYQIQYVKFEDITDSYKSATSAAAAQQSRTDAANSATDASTSASTATTQAGLAATSEFTTRIAAALLFPSDFTADGKYWFNGSTGSPATVALTPLTDNGSTIRFITTGDGFGRVLQLVGGFSGNLVRPGSVGASRLVSGRRYRLTGRYRMVGTITTPVSIFVTLLPLDNSYAAVGSGTTTNVTPTDTAWHDIVVELDASTAIAAGGVFVRALFGISSTANPVDTVQFQTVKFEDVTSESAALNSATAANLSAGTASTQATNAGNSAIAANTSALNAASSYTATLGAASLTLPQDFEQDDRFFTPAQVGSPTSVVGFTGVTYQSVSGYGRTLRTGRTGQIGLFTRGLLPIVGGRRYRVTAIFRQFQDADNGATFQYAGLYCAVLDSSYGFVSIPGAQFAVGSSLSFKSNLRVSDGWQTFKGEWTGDALIALSSSAAYGRFGVLGNWTASQGGSEPNGSMEFSKLIVEDVTESVTAANSATAANLSASTANTKAGEAGNSATAANTSALNAASSYTGAVKAAAATFPSTFEQGLTFFTDAASFTVGTPRGDHPLATAFSITTVSGEGVVLDYFPSAGQGSAFVTPKTPVLVGAGRSHKVRVRQRITSGVAQTRYVGFGVYNSSGVNIAFMYGAQVSLAVGGAWDDLSYTVTSDQVLAAQPTAVYLIPAVLLNYPNTTSTTTHHQVSLLKYEDVTESTAASISASASAVSASNANTSAGAAGTSAANAATSQVLSAAFSQTIGKTPNASFDVGDVGFAKNNFTWQNDATQGAQYRSTTGSAANIYPTIGVEIDTTRKYRIHAKFYIKVVSQFTYVGIECLDAAGNSLGSVYTTAYNSTNVAASGTPYVAEQVFTGEGATSGSSSTLFITGTKKVKPLFLANWGSAATGYTDLVELYIEDATESLTASSFATAASTSATNANASAASAATSQTIAASYSTQLALTPNAHFINGVSLWGDGYTTFDGGSAQPSSIYNATYQGRSDVVKPALGAALYIASKCFAIDVTRKYRVKAGFYSGVAGVSHYWGLSFFDASKTWLGQRYGSAGSTSSSGAGWTDLTTNFILGAGSTGEYIPATAAFALPFAFVNYHESGPGGNGKQGALDYLYAEDISESTAAATSASAASGSATNANNSASTALTYSNLAAAYSRTVGQQPNGTLDSPIGWSPENMTWGDYGGSIGTAFRATAATTAYLKSTDFIEIDTTRKYRLTIRFRVYTVNQIFYAAVECYNAAGTLLGNAYFPAMGGGNYAPSGSDYLISDVYTGEAATPPAFNVQTQFITGTKKVKLFGITNYTANSGYAEILSFYLEDVTESKAAETFASAASGSAVSASTSAASSQSFMTLSASLISGGLIFNSNFQKYTNATGIPDGWADEASGSNAYRVTGELAGQGYASRFPAAAGTNAYYKFVTNPGSIQTGLTYVIEADVMLNSGSFVGSGVLFRVYTAGGANTDYNFVFSNELVNGVAVGAGTTGIIYRFRKTIKVTSDNASYTNFYLMTHWSGLGSIAAAADITWYKCSLRPLSDAENQAVYGSPLVNQIAGAVAELQGKTSAYWSLDVATGTGASAFISARADATNDSSYPLTWRGPGISLNRVVVTGRELYRNSTYTTDDWAVAVYSNEFYTGSAFMSATNTSANAYCMFGLASAPGPNYTNIDYGIYFDPGTTFFIYEAGSQVYSISPYDLTGRDVFSVDYSGTTVNYRKNGMIFRTTTTTAGRTFYAQVGMARHNKYLRNIVFAPSVPGNASTVALGAAELHIYNQVDGSWKKALSFVGGDAVFYGGLQANAYIRLGTGSGWPVALAQKDFAVTDGQTVTFPVNLVNVPNLTFQANNLLALGTNETYNLYADSLTSTGFTARIRKQTPGTPSTINLTSATTPGSGPTYQIARGGNGEASDYNYRFSFTMSITQPPSYVEYEGGNDYQ